MKLPVLAAVATSKDSLDLEWENLRGTKCDRLHDQSHGFQFLGY